jgi:hypothetical protein
MKPNGSTLTVMATEDEDALHNYAVCDRICLVRRSEMPTAMIEHAVVTVIKTIEKLGHESEDFCGIAKLIKEEFNRRFGKTWHCLVLIRGGSSLTHEQGRYICIEYDPFLLTLFKQ